MAHPPRGTPGFGDRLRIRDVIAEVVRPEARQITLTPVRAPRGGRVAAPKLVVEPPVELVSPGTNRVAKIHKISLFTATTKMRCGSFSLPAGPPKMGGTCPAAGLKPEATHASDWICYGCYATTGNYVFTSVQTVQALRKEWVRRTMAEGSFVDLISWALAQYLASPRHAAIPLPGNRVARVALDPRYFRIHDSGDFSWLGPAYALAWAEIARRMPKVRFWAPTRDWVFDRMLPSLRAAPSNLSIRPSALYVDEKPPAVEGLGAGTTVAFGATRGVWDCPAYAADEHSCETGINPAGKKGCRVCWIHPEREVNYRPHGGISETKLVQLRVKKNPSPPFQVSLDELYDRFEREARAPRRNPAGSTGEAPRIFEAWLAANHMPPSTYGEVDWVRMLDRHGLRDLDAQAEYLERIAEWG